MGKLLIEVKEKTCFFFGFFASAPHLEDYYGFSGHLWFIFWGAMTKDRYIRTILLTHGLFDQGLWDKCYFS